MTDTGALAGLKASILRTVVPLAVGFIARWLVSLGIQLPDEALEALVTSAIAAVITAAYYVAVRVLERVRSSKWGWLLGYPAAPTYPSKHAAPDA